MPSPEPQAQAWLLEAGGLTNERLTVGFDPHGGASGGELDVTQIAWYMGNVTVFGGLGGCLLARWFRKTFIAHEAEPTSAPTRAASYRSRARSRASLLPPEPDQPPVFQDQERLRRWDLAASDWADEPYLATL